MTIVIRCDRCSVVVNADNAHYFEEEGLDDKDLCQTCYDAAIIVLTEFIKTPPIVEEATGMSVASRLYLKGDEFYCPTLTFIRPRNHTSRHTDVYGHSY